MLGALADGNLTERISSRQQGTFGQLQDDANTTVARLTQIVVALQSSAAAIRGLTGDSETTAQEHLRGPSHLVSMDGTAAALAQLTATVKHNADGAAQATHLALEARRLAESGGEITARAVAAVQQIDDSSRQVVDVISVIDDIAFQKTTRYAPALRKLFSGEASPT